MTEIEIIKGKKVKVYDTEKISGSEAAQLLNLSRQRISQLFAEYQKTEGKSGIYCFRDREYFYTNIKTLRTFYKNRIKNLFLKPDLRSKKASVVGDAESVDQDTD